MAEVIFDPDWFDVIKFNMRELGAGMVGVHVWKVGYTCQLLHIPVSSLTKENHNIWEELRQIAYSRWKHQKEITEATCPRCGSLIRLCRRLWKGDAFCGTCGIALLP